MGILYEFIGYTMECQYVHTIPYQFELRNGVILFVNGDLIGYLWYFDGMYDGMYHGLSSDKVYSSLKKDPSHVDIMGKSTKILWPFSIANC